MKCRTTLREALILQTKDLAKSKRRLFRYFLAEVTHSYHDEPFFDLKSSQIARGCGKKQSQDFE